MKRDTNDVAQDDAVSATSTTGWRLPGKVDDAARTCYERVRGNSASIGMKTVVQIIKTKESTSELKQTKAINLATVEWTKVRRRNPQKARKAGKLTQTAPAAMIKQKVENMCWIGRQRNREGEKCTITTQQQLYHVKEPHNRRIVAKQLLTSSRRRTK